MGTLHGEKDALVIFAHVYDYFNYYGLNPFTLNLGSTLFFTLGQSLFSIRTSSAVILMVSRFSTERVLIMCTGPRSESCGHTTKDWLRWLIGFAVVS